MGLGNARDSFVDLLVAKKDKEELQRLLDEGPDERGSGRVNPQIGFRIRPGGVNRGGGTHEARSRDSAEAIEPADCGDELCYEPCEVGEDDEESWPVWEMTGDHDKDVENAAICERIFTVPEVYEELERLGSSTVSSLVLRDDPEDEDGGACHNIFSCFTPWKEPTSVIHTNSSALSDARHDKEEDETKSKGVIKRSSMAVQLYMGMPISARQSFTPSMYKVLSDEDGAQAQGGERGKRRASIVGSKQSQVYTVGGNGHEHEEKETSSRKMYKVHFSELKQALRVRKIEPTDAIDVWYQREDFDLFKNQMSLLLQEESHELADVWLDSDEWARRKGGQLAAEGEESSDVDLEDTAASRDSDRPSRSSGSWWHDYDHSRRGLERYASPVQALQMHVSMKKAIQQVLGEQQRQRLLTCICVPSAHNPDKIAEVYHEYNAWSRDLALAAAASDADAVGTDFDDSKRHTREYYMLKQVMKSGYKVHKHMPAFMLPKCITPKGFLDESESLYFENRGGDGMAGRGLLQSLMSTGMGRSQLSSGDLEGPVSPALAVSLQVNEGSKKNIGAHPSPKGNVEPTKRRTSMAEKAKNYPFQQ